MSCSVRVDMLLHVELPNVAAALGLVAMTRCWPSSGRRIESRRAMITERLATLADGVKKGKEGACFQAPSLTQSEAAKLMNVSRDSVQRARSVAKAAPDLAEKVRGGEMKLYPALALPVAWGPIKRHRVRR